MIAVYPGTFDPVTTSHSAIISRAVNIFGQLIVAIAADTTKHTLFSLEDRVQMMQEEISTLSEAAYIQVMPFRGLLVNFASQHNIKVIVRGLRALSDFEYEFKMSYMNKKLNENIDTIFIHATEKENFISSSFVREIARLGGDVTSLVPSHVAQKLRTIFTYT